MITELYDIDELPNIKHSHCHQQFTKVQLNYMVIQILVFRHNNFPVCLIAKQ